MPAVARASWRFFYYFVCHARVALSLKRLLLQLIFHADFQAILCYQPPVFPNQVVPLCLPTQAPTGPLSHTDVRLLGICHLGELLRIVVTLPREVVAAEMLAAAEAELLRIVVKLPRGVVAAEMLPAAEAWILAAEQQQVPAEWQQVAERK